MNTYIGMTIGSVFFGVLQVGFKPPTTERQETEYKQELRKMLVICKDAEECQSIQHVIDKAR